MSRLYEASWLNFPRAPLQRAGWIELATVAALAAELIRNAKRVATKLQAAANISHTPATA